MIRSLNGVFRMNHEPPRALTPPETTAAYKFLEEHEKLQRNLMLARDEISALKVENAQAKNMAEVMANQIDDLKKQLASERARANAWVAHSMGLCAQDEAINAIMKERSVRARAAADEAVRQGLITDHSPEDQKQIEKIAETFKPAELPKNQL